jgi:hypothetical protein
MHMVAAYFEIVLELFYQSPRPFWVDDQILSPFCSNTYAEPAFFIFHLSFVSSYSLYIWKKRYQRTGQKSKLYILLGFFLMIFIGLYSFLLFIIGHNFLNQTIITLFYFVVIFVTCILLDEKIEKLVLRSTVQVIEAKSMVFKWLGATIGALVFGSIIYESSASYVDISWIINYVWIKLHCW